MPLHIPFPIFEDACQLTWAVRTADLSASASKHERHRELEPA